jgi:hypothetical protein
MVASSAVGPSCRSRSHEEDIVASQSDAQTEQRPNFPRTRRRLRKMLSTLGIIAILVIGLPPLLILSAAFIMSLLGAYFCAHTTARIDGC